MGTRAMIVVSGENDKRLYSVKLFRHWDGYPEAVLPELTKAVAEFFAVRGHEPDMLMAYLTEQLRKNHGDMLGYRLSDKIFSDVEYVYQVTLNGKIKVRVPKETFWEKPTLQNTTVWSESK